MSIFSRTRSTSSRPGSSQLRFDTLETRIVPANAITRALDLPENATSDNSEAAIGSIAVANNLWREGMGGFPTGSDADFLILSNGDATKAYAPRPHSYPHFGKDFGAKGAADDLQHLRVTVPIAPGVTHVKFDFNFMSDEVPGPLNEFDDAFSVLATPLGGGSTETLVQLHVNDDPFEPGSPVNAIYARHTGAFVADYRVPAGANWVQFDFYIADRPAKSSSDAGDGTGDTAVALDNFRFTYAKQTIWLNFESGTLTNFPAGGGSITSIPAFNRGDIGSVADRSTLINSILSNVAALYSAYDIDFTLTKPTNFTNFGSIFIGGASDNDVLVGPGVSPLSGFVPGTHRTVGDIFGDRLFGRAQMDYGNDKQDSVGFVMSRKFANDPLFTSWTSADLQKQLELTIAHEAAHSLGAPHVLDSFKDNIMAPALPINPTANFENVTRPLAEVVPKNVTSLNIHSYLSGVLGSSTGSSFYTGQSLRYIQFILNMVFPSRLFQASVGVSTRSGSITTDGSPDDGVEWFTFNELKQGLNQLRLPNYGPDTRITIFGSTVDGGPIDFFSGIPTGGNMTYDESFVRLFDESTGEPVNEVQAAQGSIGSLTPAAGIGFSLSEFASPGLVMIDPKAGFTFEDDNGDTVTVKLTSKTGIAAIELNDPDGDGKGSIARIELQGTTIKDKLSVKVKKGAGDGLVDIGSVSGSALNSFSAKYSDLTGTGLTFGGQVKSIELHDVEGGADILVGGNFSTKTSIKLHDVADETDISVDGRLTLSAARIGDGTIQAAILSKLSVKGDAKAASPISGDFKSDVTIVPGKTLSAKEAKMNLLGSVSIAGRTEGATFVVPGNAGAFKTGTFDHSSILIGYTPNDPLDPFAGGVFNGEFKLASFNAVGFKNLLDPTFENSNLIAAKFGGISLGTVRTDNSAHGGLDYGVAAKAGVAKNLPSVKTKTGSFTFDPKGALPQSFEDLFVKVI